LEEAKNLFLDVVAGFERIYGSNHPDTLIASTSLAIVLSKLGDETAAELLCRVVETSTQVLGQDHEDTFSRINTLAVIYERQGRLEDAELFRKQCMERNLRILGPDRAETLVEMAKLVSLYQKMEKWKELKDISSQMATITAKFSRKHPETLLCLGKQTSACTNLGELKEAESLYMEVVEARIELLGQSMILL
jgi:Tetratricopeptide repeat